jgi:nucleotide-binding universal stress UspA family protein
MTLLVAYDGSPLGADLLASSRALAAAADWSVCVLVIDEPGGGRAVPDDDPALAGLELQRTGGRAADEILRAAEHHDAAVVALGLRSDERAGLGHVAEEMLLNSPNMLLVMRPGMRVIAGLRRILVPLEGSPSTSAAMRLADDAFCTRGREIVMLHAVTQHVPGEPGSMPAPRFVDQEHYDWMAWQEEFCMRFSQCPKGGRHRVCVRVGEPAEVIMREAQDLGAELIALSWKQDLGQGRARRIRRLLQDSPCPLLIVGSQPDG